jgi:hypothetical protein
MKPPIRAARTWFDAEDLRVRALQAMQRAKLAVHPVPVLRASGCYTLSTEPHPLPDSVLSRADAERYAAAINGEAELARMMLAVLAELDAIKGELEQARTSGVMRIHSDTGGGG